MMAAIPIMHGSPGQLIVPLNLSPAGSGIADSPLLFLTRLHHQVHDSGIGH